MVTVKAVFSVEANEEIKEHIKTKKHYIGVNGINVRTSSNEAVQAIYNLTKVLPNSELSEPKFKSRR